jgi:hypothetical protein
LGGICGSGTAFGIAFNNLGAIVADEGKIGRMPAAGGLRQGVMLAKGLLNSLKYAQLENKAVGVSKRIARDGDLHAVFGPRLFKECFRWSIRGSHCAD